MEALETAAQCLLQAGGAITPSYRQVPVPARGLVSSQDQEPACRGSRAGAGSSSPLKGGLPTPYRSTALGGPSESDNFTSGVPQANVQQEGDGSSLAGAQARQPGHSPRLSRGAGRDSV